jgi:hypothetical protein
MARVGYRPMGEILHPRPHPWVWLPSLVMVQAFFATSVSSQRLHRWWALMHGPYRRRAPLATPLVAYSRRRHTSGGGVSQGGSHTPREGGRGFPDRNTPRGGALRVVTPPHAVGRPPHPLFAAPWSASCHGLVQIAGGWRGSWHVGPTPHMSASGERTIQTTCVQIRSNVWAHTAGRRRKWQRSG